MVLGPRRVTWQAVVRMKLAEFGGVFGREKAVEIASSSVEAEPRYVNRETHTKR